MKYIILKLSDDRKLPIIFPECLTHSFVAGAMQLAIDTLDPKKDRRPLQCRRLLSEGQAKPSAAGFVSISEAETYGMSESLDIKPTVVDCARIIYGGSIEYMPDGLIAGLEAKRQPSIDPTLKALRSLMGYYQDGSDTTVTLSQDDATGELVMRLGRSSRGPCFTGSSIKALVEAAVKAGHGNEP